MRKLMILLACALAFGGAAACSKNKPADNNSSNASETKDEDPGAKMRAYAQCMRDHGVPMDDPVVTSDGNGRTKVDMRAGGPSGAPKGDAGPEFGSDAFKKAEEECRSLMPQGGDLGPGPTAEDEEHMRNFSKCMRENGVENFPDPQPGGGIAIGPEMGVNPDDPAFKEAEKKCEELMPAPKDGGPGKVTS